MGNLGECAKVFFRVQGPIIEVHNCRIRYQINKEYHWCLVNLRRNRLIVGYFKQVWGCFNYVFLEDIV